VERSKPQPSQGKDVRATDAPQARDCHAFSAQDLLLIGGYPADVAGKCLTVGEASHDNPITTYANANAHDAAPQ
jgi:hypothetical protein